MCKQPHVFNCRNMTKITENKSRCSRSLKNKFEVDIINFFLHQQDDRVPVALQCAKHSTAQVVNTTLVFPTHFFLNKMASVKSQAHESKTKNSFERGRQHFPPLLVLHSHISMHKTAV